MGKFLDYAFKKKFKMSGKNLNTTARNEFSKELLDYFKNDVIPAELVEDYTLDGLIISIPNDELGALYYAVKLVAKPLDYDLVNKIKLYKMDKEEKEEKKRIAEENRINRQKKQKAKKEKEKSE